jgi:VanZ family protein
VTKKLQTLFTFGIRDPHMTLIEPSASPFSRACLVAYTVLILYASCYPFSGWQFEALAAYLDQIQEWPHYWIRFDVLINVIGYIPFGLLIVFSCYPNISRTWSIFVALLCGLFLSFCMESLQFLLPSRVTSPLDIVTNSLGAVVGGLLGALITPTVLDNGQLHHLRSRWLWRESPREIVIIGLWPLAQIYPQAFLFGHGQVLNLLSQAAENYLGLNIDFSAVLRQGVELSAELYLISETIITACGCAGAILFALSLLNRHAPKFRLASLIFISGLCMKTLASALMFGPENAFAWLTPGAQGGMGIGILILYGFSFAPNHAQRRLAILLLLISLILVNLIPSNPYFLNTLQNMVQGKMLNFYGAAQFLAIAWPFGAIWYLSKRQHTHSN